MSSRKEETKERILQTRLRIILTWYALLQIHPITRDINHTKGISSRVYVSVPRARRTTIIDATWNLSTMGGHNTRAKLANAFNMEKCTSSRKYDRTIERAERVANAWRNAVFVAHAMPSMASRSDRSRISRLETRSEKLQRDRLLTPWDKRAPRSEDVYTAIAAHSGYSVIGRFARDVTPSTATREMDVFSYSWPKNRESLYNTIETIMAAPLDDKRYRLGGREMAPNRIYRIRERARRVTNCQRIETTN